VSTKIFVGSCASAVGALVARVQEDTGYMSGLLMNHGPLVR